MAGAIGWILSSLTGNGGILELPADTARAGPEVQAPSVEPTRESEIAKPRLALPSERHIDTTRFLRVAVINAETGAPVPNAAVFFTPPNTRWNHLEGPDLALWLASDKDLLADEVMRRFGRVVHSDSDGLVPIPIDARPIGVACWHEGLYGRLQLGGRQSLRSGELRLKLQEDLSFDIRAISASGRARAGVELGIKWSTGAELAKAQRRPGTTRFGITTRGTAGIAQLRHWQCDPGFHFGIGREQDPVLWTEIVPWVPGLPVNGTRIDLSALPDTAIELVLPPVGRFEIEVRGEDGSILHEGVRVSLSELDELGRSWSREKDEALVFDPVALDKRYMIRVSVGGRQISRDCAGPTEASPSCREVFRFDGRSEVSRSGVVFRGRAHREGGEPLDKEWIRILLPGLRQSHPVCTDATGQFEANLDVYMRGMQMSSFQLLTLDDQKRCLDEGTDMRPLSHELTAGSIIELGDLLVTRGHVLVRGRFTGDRSEFFGKVAIGLQRRTTTRVVSGTRKEEWSRHRGQSIERPSSDTFIVRSRRSKGTFRLRFFSGWHAAIDPVSVQSEMTDLTVELRASYRLLSQVVVPRALTPDFVALFLKPNGTFASDTFIPFHERGPHRAEVLSSEPGLLNYQWPRVAAGEYQVAVRMIGSPSPIVLHSVTLPLKSRDTIDLRNKVNHFRLHLEQRGGKSLSSALCLIETGFENRVAEGFFMDGASGFIDIFTAQASTEIFLQGGVSASRAIPDFVLGRRRGQAYLRPLTNTRITSSQGLVLEPREELRIAVKLSAVTLPLDYQLVCKISLDPPFTPKRLPFISKAGSSVTDLDPGQIYDGTRFVNGVGDLLVTRAGRYRLQLFYGTKMRYLPVETFEPRHIEVHAGPAEDRVELRVTQAAIAAVQKRLRAKK